jgi:hypothetical protein
VGNAPGAGEQLPAGLADAPLDAKPISLGLLSKHLPELAGEHLKDQVNAFLESERDEAAEVRRRGQEHGTERVRWWAGCWFQHRLFHYHAVILGWTVGSMRKTCKCRG